MNVAYEWAKRNLLRLVAAAALLALSVVMAAYNAGGFLGRGLPLLAALAVITELLAFVMAVNAESAFRGVRWPVWLSVGPLLKGLACVAILIGCEVFNAAGSHLAWDGDQKPRLEQEQQAAQRALDARRAALQVEIAAVPLPDPEHGPQRQAAEQRTWEAATATARRQLDALPLVATVQPAFAPEVVWGFLAFLGFAKSLGLWAVGMSVGGSSRKPETENVVDFNPGRELVNKRWANRKTA